MAETLPEIALNEGLDTPPPAHMRNTALTNSTHISPRKLEEACKKHGFDYNDVIAKAIDPSNEEVPEGIKAKLALDAKKHDLEEEKFQHKKELDAQLANNGLPPAMVIRWDE